MYYHYLVCLITAGRLDIIDKRALVFDKNIKRVKNVERYLFGFRLNQHLNLLNEDLCFFHIVKLKRVFGKLLFGVELVLEYLKLGAKVKGFTATLHQTMIRFECRDFL